MTDRAHRSHDVTSHLNAGAHVHHTPSGAVFHRDAAGIIDGVLPSIKSVGVADLADVTRHDIAWAVGSTSHRVQFSGGGELRYVYNDRGEVVELCAARVVVSLSADRRLVFAPLTAKGKRDVTM